MTTLFVLYWMINMCYAGTGPHGGRREEEEEGGGWGADTEGLCSSGVPLPLN